MSIINRFSTITKGGIVMIGNTLGLSKTDNSNNAGTRSSIGAFISLDNTQCVTTYPQGTTLDYTRNGSYAPFAIPSNSTILYAELIWGGLYAGGKNDLSAVIDDAVKLSTPNGQYFVKPDIAIARNYSINLDGNLFKIYNCSADVTSSLKGVTNGNISVEQVPALIEPIDNVTCFTNHAGWTLIVAYTNNAMSQKSLAIWSGAELVSHNNNNVVVALDGIDIPSQLKSARLFLSAQEGDAGIDGDQVQLGQSANLLYTLSGVNNMPNNFFASQINDYNGELSTDGSFGQNNANAVTGQNTVACRQGWDITAVDVTKYINGTKTPIVNFVSSGDLYLPNGYAMEVQFDESPSSSITVTKSVNKTQANIGELFTHTNIVNNKGYDNANIMFYSDIPNDTQFVMNSLKVNGITVVNHSPSQGVKLPKLSNNQNAKIEYSVKIVSSSKFNSITNQSFATDGTTTSYSNTVITHINKQCKIIPYVRCHNQSKISTKRCKCIDIICNNRTRRH